ncbi:MAG: YicC family protein [Acidobacteriota bacterium]|nr:YicC family protein [Acidobacteriota bacterium]
MTGRLRSMTGYAEAAAEEHGRVVRASVRSVNHRFLDLHAHVPEGLEALEPVVRGAVRGKVRRGHLDVYVRVESVRPAEVRVNGEAAAMYLEAMEQMKAKFGLEREPDLGAIFRLPGVVEAGSLADAAEIERITALLEGALGRALTRLDKMRLAEGTRLGEEMARAVARMAEMVDQLGMLGERARPAYAERLRERMRELLGTSPVDPARLAQEAALVAARSDTTEEITRLGSHMEQFSRALDGPGEAGKTLDFLCQEMQREVNTTLAKAPALGPDGLEITRLGLGVKAEIEKLREQVQNIE